MLEVFERGNDRAFLGRRSSRLPRSRARGARAGSSDIRGSAVLFQSTTSTEVIVGELAGSPLTAEDLHRLTLNSQETTSPTKLHHQAHVHLQSISFGAEPTVASSQSTVLAGSLQSVTVAASPELVHPSLLLLLPKALFESSGLQGTAGNNFCRQAICGQSQKKKKKK